MILRDFRIKRRKRCACVYCAAGF